MSGNVIVGFAPAVAAGSGAATASGSEAKKGPLGLFGALLGAVLPDAGQTVVAPPGLAKMELPDLPPGLAMLARAAGVLPGEAAPAGDEVSFEPEPPQLAELPAPGLAETIAPTSPGGDTPLLEELVGALSALEIALAAGEAIPPALEQKLEGLLSRLSAALGIEPAAESAPGPEAPDGPAPLAALAPIVPTSAAEAAVSPTPAPATAAEPADSTEQPLLQRLSVKLGSFAAELRPQASQLADALTALAGKLESGAVTPQQLAAIGIEGDPERLDPRTRQALLALLSAAPPKAAPSPALLPLAAPSLPTPEALLAPPRERGAMPAPPQQQKDVAPPAPLSQAPAAPAAVPPRLAPERQPAQAAALPAHVGEAPVERSGPTLPPTVAPMAAAAVAAVGTTPAARAAQAAYQAPLQQLNLPQVAFEIVRQFQAGHSRFQIRLDPPELGRIDVRMELDRDGTVHARMTVEKAETLDLMQRDQRTLEKALAQAGLDGNKTTLEFSLRQQTADREQRGGQHPAAGWQAEDSAEAEQQTNSPAPASHHGTLRGGLNLFV